MIEVAPEEMQGSDRVHDMNRITSEPGLAEQSNNFNKSEMALFYECMLERASNTA